MTIKPGIRQAIRATAAGLRERLADRPDTEHEQAIIRAMIVFIVLLYYTVLDVMRPADHPPVGYLTITLYEATALLILAWIAVQPAPSPPRRILGILGDLGAISVLMAQVGTAATPLYPLYLWIILGNGFRFGGALHGHRSRHRRRGIWGSHHDGGPLAHLSELSAGLLIGLVIIPAYTARLIRQLTEAKAEAEAANAAKSRFLATVSHEFRTPLNAIIGMARVLDNGAGATTADQRDAARVIRTSGEALRFLVEDILDLSRLEAGKTIIASADVPIHRELSETATVFAHQAEEKGLRLAVVLDPMVPTVVTLDWPHVRQIVINIIANAIKFTEQGHVIVRLAAETASEESRRLVLTVEDTGIGISPDDMSRIFEPFAQADDGVNRRFDGSGLGLAISAELAKAMNGTLDVESTPGKGSCFRLSLPLIVGGTLAPVSDVEPAPLLADAAAAPLLAAAGIAHTVPAGGPGALARHLAKADPAVPIVVTLPVPPTVADAAKRERRPVVVVLAEDRLAAIDAAGLLPLPVSVLATPSTGAAALRATWRDLLKAAPHDAGVAEHPAAADRRPLHVLVAEDNAVNIKVMRTILEKARHTFDVVRNGDALLEALANTSHDAALVDVNMPGMPVLDAIKLHRMAEGGAHHLPVIAVTADATEETRRACDNAGIDDVLLKPVSPTALLEALDRLTADAPARATPAHPSVVPMPRAAPPPVDIPQVESLLELGGRSSCAILQATSCPTRPP